MHAPRALGKATPACVTQQKVFPRVGGEENEKRDRHMALSCSVNLAAARFILCRLGSTRARTFQRLSLQLECSVLHSFGFYSFVQMLPHCDDSLGDVLNLSGQKQPKHLMWSGWLSHKCITRFTPAAVLIHVNSVWKSKLSIALDHIDTVARSTYINLRVQCVGFFFFLFNCWWTIPSVCHILTLYRHFGLMGPKAWLQRGSF